MTPTSIPDECFNAAPASRRPRPIIAFVAMVCSVDFLEDCCLLLLFSVLSFVRLISHFLLSPFVGGKLSSPSLHNITGVEYVALNDKVLQEVEEVR